MSRTQKCSRRFTMFTRFTQYKIAHTIKDTHIHIYLYICVYIQIYKYIYIYPSNKFWFTLACVHKTVHQVHDFHWITLLYGLYGSRCSRCSPNHRFNRAVQDVHDVHGIKENRNYSASLTTAKAYVNIKLSHILSYLFQYKTVFIV